MTGEVVFEIARYANDGDAEFLVERTQLVVDGASLRRRDHVGIETPAMEGNPVAVIAADASLNEVRVAQVTRIEGRPSVLQALPLFLRVVADAGKLSPEVWDDEESGWVSELDCVLHVNGVPWAPFATVDGIRMLPTDDVGPGWAGRPALADTWAEFGFAEAGGMTAGFDHSTIGLATPDAVVQILRSDDEEDRVLVTSRGDDDARTVTRWLFGSMPYLDDYVGGSTADTHRMLVQLFVEAALNGRNGQPIAGSWLAAGVAKWADSFGVGDTATWTLTLNLTSETIAEALDQLAASPDFRDIVTAGRDASSVAGRARLAALSSE